MPHPSCRSVIQMNQKKAEASHVWHCGSSSPLATCAAVFSLTDNERNGECLHLCERIIVIACVWLCFFFVVVVFSPNIGKWSLSFAFFHGVLLLGNCPYAS